MHISMLIFYFHFNRSLIFFADFHGFFLPFFCARQKTFSTIKTTLIFSSGQFVHKATEKDEQRLCGRSDRKMTFPVAQLWILFLCLVKKGDALKSWEEMRGGG